MTEIVPRLYLGGLEEVMHECEHHSLGVTHILNVAAEIHCDRSSDYTYKHKAVEDDDNSADIASILQECVEWVHTAMTHSERNRVMVHCWSGISRSVCVVLAFLAVVRHLSLNESLNLVRQKRPQIEPWPRYLNMVDAWVSHQLADGLGAHHNGVARFTNAA